MAASPPIELQAHLLAGWADELGLPRDVVTSLCRVYVPLASWLSRRKAALGRPLVVGINGAQGTGKSTLLWLMTRLLPRLHDLRSAGLSLDDLYLTAAQRTELALHVHPLLRTRGVPGTHDLALGAEVIDHLTGSVGSYALPVFDKASDDRTAPAAWPEVEVPVDIVILEGWCVGARPQGEQALATPCNTLERDQDADGSWRGYVDRQLRGPYAAFFERIDVLLMMRAPDMACVRRWRIEQEHALSLRLSHEGRPDTTMSDLEVEHFVQHFERLTREMLREMPARADVVIEIDRDHRLVAAHYRDGAAAAAGGSSPIVFTDLDGTLLDHDTYDHAPARPALDALRERGIPLVLVTSKTRDEVLALRRKLGHTGPFIVENGGAIYVPEGTLPDLPGVPTDGLHAVVQGVPYLRIRRVLARLRAEGSFRFEGFGDVSSDTVASWTGLSPQAAARAQARACSEPIRHLGSDADLARLREALASEGLSLVRGGRFFSVQGPADKGDAVRLLLEWFREARGGRMPTTIALGDSDNDLPMLRAVDIPIVIAPAHGRPRVALAHPRLIAPAEPGPEGFRVGIEAALDQLEAD